MTGRDDQMSESRLLEALDSFNSYDLDHILSFFAEDAVYHASFGPELYGRTYRGKPEVRRGIEQFFETYPDGSFKDTQVNVAGAHGSAEWVFVFPNSDGTETRIRGCDLLEFDGDLIRLKNAFRKSTTQT